MKVFTQRTTSNESGFFLQIADEHYPELQFRTNDTTILKRWNEIMNEINEGRI